MPPLDSNPQSRVEREGASAPANAANGAGQKQDAEPGRAKPWQLYGMMVDALRESQDLIDLVDHKTRFALIIVGALNAGFIILGTRSDMLAVVPVELMGWTYGYLAVYAFFTIYCLFQAIESLRPRPRGIGAFASVRPDSEEERILGLRGFDEALHHDETSYVKAWQSVRVGQVNAELAAQLHTLARINKAKYRAIGRLYSGLRIITLLTAGLLFAIGAAAWIDHQTTEDAVQAEANSKSGKSIQREGSILGEPARIAVPGVKEPSGIVFSPHRGTFFVVGDEGSLVEISRDAKVVARILSGGNLEDVAVHSPSGRLVLLSEKKGELIVLDPVTAEETGRFRLDDGALLGEAGVDRNQGFEGLAFRAETERPGGGVFYLVHQRAPAMLIAIAFDPLGPSGNIGVEALVSRGTVAGRDDLTAVTYDVSLDRLFVIADSSNRLVMLKLSGDQETEIVLPGTQQEGAAFDPRGNLWIADDRIGLLVFRGARAKIAAAMKMPPPPPAPPGNPS